MLCVKRCYTRPLADLFFLKQKMSPPYFTTKHVVRCPIFAIRGYFDTYVQKLRITFSKIIDFLEVIVAVWGVNINSVTVFKLLALTVGKDISIQMS